MNKLIKNKIYVNLCYCFCCALFFMSNLGIFKMILHCVGVRKGKTIISAGVFCAFDVCLCVYYLYKIFKEKKYKHLIYFICINLIYCLPYMINRDINKIALYIVFISPVCIFAALIVMNIDFSVEKFISILNKMSYGAFILCIIYLIVLSTKKADSYGTVSIPEFTYGNIAYAVLVFLYADIEFIFRKQTKYDIFCLVRIAIYISTIIYTGNRSTMICMAILLLLQFFRNIKTILKVKWYMNVIACVLVVISFAFSTNVNISGSRLNIVKSDVLYEVQDIHKSQILNIETGKFDTMNNIFNYYIVKSNKTRVETVDMLYDDIHNLNGKYIKIDEENIDAQNYQYLMNRVNLWPNAISEFKKSPVIGNGVLYFQNKYVAYFPHNIILEALCDFGVVGLLLLLLIALCCFVIFIRLIIITKNKNISSLLVFMLMYIPSYLFYTSLYSNSILIFTIFICIGLAIKYRRLLIPSLNNKR